MVIFLITISILLTSCSLPKNITDSDNVINSEITTIVEFEDSEKEYVSVEVVSENEIVSFDIDEELYNQLVAAKDCTTSVEVNEVFIGDINIVDSVNQKWHYGKYIVDSSGNRYIKANGSNGMLLIE